MRYDFCTLFDRNYLFRGLALYESLEAHAGDFTLWVLCMDDLTYETLEKMGLARARLIRLAEFEDEDEELLTAKQDRTPVEYCWTCTPSLPLYLLEHHPEIEMVTYLDADLYFFSDPAPVYSELADGSVGIIGHRFSASRLDGEARYGVYNVSFVVFRNDERARTVLAWWRERCNEWCYDRIEDGKMGDQRYLDDWPDRFDGVVVLTHKGAGLAPWNLERYELTEGPSGPLVDGVPLVYYHYHALSILNARADLLPARPEYVMEEASVGILYPPYKAAIGRAIAETRNVSPGYSYGIDAVSLKAARSTERLMNRLSDFVYSVPLLRRVWLWIKRMLGREEPPPPPIAADPAQVRDSWRSDDVAGQQQALVERELLHPEDVPPFRSFLEVMKHVSAEWDDDVATFLDLGCGVGHYSELLRRYFPGRFDYTGADYSEAMIERARALWPEARFVVDDVLDSQLVLGGYDILMAGALVDVLEDFWSVLDILFANTSRLLILHRQRVTAKPSYSEIVPGYPGQLTFAAHINRAELEQRLADHGLRIEREFEVTSGIHSFLIVSHAAVSARHDQ